MSDMTNGQVNEMQSNGLIETDVSSKPPSDTTQVLCTHGVLLGPKRSKISQLYSVIHAFEKTEQKSVELLIKVFDSDVYYIMRKVVKTLVCVFCDFGS